MQPEWEPGDVTVCVQESEGGVGFVVRATKSLMKGVYTLMRRYNNRERFQAFVQDL